MSRPGAHMPRRAEALGATLPPLVVAAERVAATVAPGVHGRRRVGPGESFWQYRPFTAGDSAGRIDWRRSARADGRYFVRESEWEAAETVLLWRDGGPGMCWRAAGAEDKIARAELLLLALAALLLRGGERVWLLGTERAVAGRAGLPRLAEELAAATGSEVPQAVLPRHARAVLIGDFLQPPEEVQAVLGRFAAAGVRGHLLQVLDPAEVELPYTGRVRFEPPGRGPKVLVPRVETLRGAYRRRLTEHQATLAALAAAAGFGWSMHRTDAAPEAALLALHEALEGAR